MVLKTFRTGVDTGGTENKAKAYQITERVYELKRLSERSPVEERSRIGKAGELEMRKAEMYDTNRYVR